MHCYHVIDSMSRCTGGHIKDPGKSIYCAYSILFTSCESHMINNKALRKAYILPLVWCDLNLMFVLFAFGRSKIFEMFHTLEVFYLHDIFYTPPLQDFKCITACSLLVFGPGYQMVVTLYCQKEVFLVCLMVFFPTKFFSPSPESCLHALSHNILLTLRNHSFICAA